MNLTTEQTLLVYKIMEAISIEAAFQKSLGGFPKRSERIYWNLIWFNIGYNHGYAMRKLNDD